jgi:twitching motility protein PilT
VATSAVRALIRDDKAHQIYSIIQTGGKFGMRTMNQSLVELVTHGTITRDESFNRTTDPDDIARSFEKRGMPVTAPATRRITI